MVLFYFPGLHVTDSGLYTCKASSWTGEEKASAYLTVIDDHSTFSNNNFNRGISLDHYPTSPSRPRLTHLTNTTATLTWFLQEKSGNTRTIIGYNIQVSRSGGKWEVLEKLHKSNTFTALLVPKVAHIFIVRSVDTEGRMSVPSPWSPLVIGGRGSARPELESPLKDSLLNLTSVAPHSPSELKITWQVSSSSNLFHLTSENPRVLTSFTF